MKPWCAVLCLLGGLAGTVQAQNAAEGELDRVLRQLLLGQDGLEYRLSLVHAQGVELSTYDIDSGGSGSGPVIHSSDGRGMPWRPAAAAMQRLGGPDERLASIYEGYEPRWLGTERVAGRECARIGFLPRDRLRYGAEFWVDRESGIPLRTLFTSHDGVPIDQVVVAHLELKAKADAAPVGGAPGTYATASGWPSWRIGMLPPGFRLRAWALRGELLHLYYSDGLAGLSMFVEPGPGVLRQPIEAQRGMVASMRGDRGGVRVTILGNVPRATVQRAYASAAPR